jgi:biopolymer transport protein ExbD
MNFRRGRAREEPDINLIPLIDILIVVLIFLFLSTTYSRFSELQINLPEASAGKAAEGPEILNIAVDSQGRYAINGTATVFGNPAAFSQRLKEAAKGRKDPVIAISADAAATHQSVIRVMEASRIAGLAQITFTTQSAK